MDAHAYATCTFCPKLCRHVCPVAVATGLESATATAMMTAAWLAATSGVPADPDALAACLGCGACTRHCKHHVPVAALLDAAATRPPLERPDAALAPVQGADAARFVTCFDGAVGAPHQLACCGRRDGFDARQPELAAEVAAENVRRLDGAAVVCNDAACAAWLRAHGARVEVG